jgi:GH15 family glucan-1,4-alpha-glucosidase
MRTVALVGLDGTIDWLCFPRFDSPSVFASILDDAKGGHYRIAPTEQVVTKQFYWPDTNVLITRFLSPGGTGEIDDFMPAGDEVESDRHDELFRRVRVTRGTLRFRLECYPAFDYARAPHETLLEEDGARFCSRDLTLGLSTSVPLRVDPRGLTAEFVLEEGREVTFVLRQLAPDQPCACPPDPVDAEEVFEATIRFWRRWLSHCTYSGRWRETVLRSALALKLLTYQPTGAIVAAPTCSLPEMIGSERNWDYRFTWLRDAAFTLYGFLRIGFTEEAGRFMEWLEARCREAETDELQIVYGIDGRRDLTEQSLEHLAGYRGSRPVRIGNGAARQLQLDVYGELMDAVYLYNKYGAPISWDLWSQLRRRLDWLRESWKLEDEGIWEFRSGRRHFVYSKLMCWVAFDRGLRLAEKRSFPAARASWLATRDEIYERIMSEGWSTKRRSFVQYFGSDSLDASNLIMPLVFFVAPHDPKMIQTLEAILRPPREGGLVSDGLVFRYDSAKEDDGVRGREGTFNMCTFWLVEALTRASRRDPRNLDL